MKIAVILSLSFLCVAAERPADILALVDGARGLPAEFSADALIRIAGSDQVPKARRPELLEEAFRRAGSAQQRMKLRPAGMKADGASFLERAARQDLDGLSLQLRALEALIPLAPAKARELFLSVAAPRPPKLACKDALVYDVSRFYAVLGRVAAETFTSRQVAKEEPFQLLMRYAAVTSPAQVGPVAHLLAAAPLRESQLRPLLAAYTASLKEIGGDDRTFSFWRQSGTETKALSEALQRNGISPLGLLESYRAYLVRHLTAARCADNMQVDVKVVLENYAGQVEKQQAPLDPGAYFNSSLRADAIPPLSVEEQTPAKVEGEAEASKGCSSPECGQIRRQYTDLVLKADKTAYSQGEKETAEWQNRLREFLAALAEWKQDTGATDADHFRLKCTIYGELLAVVPPGATRDLALRGMLRYLQQMRLLIENPGEWFLPANVLMVRTAIDPGGLGSLRNELEGSSDPVIAFYARLERLLPRTPDRLILLL